MMNRLANCKNEFQGQYRRVLCVCSAGLLRSPTAAVVLSAPPFNFNTRAAGLSRDYALIPVDRVLLHWADEIVCMMPEQAAQLTKMLLQYEESHKLVTCLGIEDSFEYRNEELMKLIAQRYQERVSAA
jgi:predicted protein tyrosine phosphatase